MTITESNRHHLHNRLEEVLGEENADTLMQHLPPVGWADVATKDDVGHATAANEERFDAVGARFDAVGARFDAVEARFATTEERLEKVLHRELSALKSSFIWMVLTSNATLGALILAAVKLFS